LRRHNATDACDDKKAARKLTPQTDLDVQAILDVMGDSRRTEQSTYYPAE